jgi:Tfp pilus assembly protein PilO
MTLNLYNEYQSSKESFEEDMRWQEKMIELKRDISRIRNEIQKINLEIPTERDLTSPLTYLDSLCQLNGVKLNSFEVVSIDTTRQYKFAILGANFTGNFRQLQKFITEIERGSFIISIKSLDFELQSFYRNEITANIKLDVILKRKKNNQI